MGCGASSEVVPEPPAVLIPDPTVSDVILCTVKKFQNLDFIAYRGTTTSPTSQWFFINVTGSLFGGDATIDLENFKRGGNPEYPKKGEILWKAQFDSKPSFSRIWKVGDKQSASEMKQLVSDFKGPAGLEGVERPDSAYFSAGEPSQSTGSIACSEIFKIMLFCLKKAAVERVARLWVQLIANE
jgi:hypothetical protein